MDKTVKKAWDRITGAIGKEVDVDSYLISMSTVEDYIEKLEEQLATISPRRDELEKWYSEHVANTAQLRDKLAHMYQALEHKPMGQLIKKNMVLEEKLAAIHGGSVSKPYTTSTRTDGKARFNDDGELCGADQPGDE